MIFKGIQRKIALAVAALGLALAGCSAGGPTGTKSTTGTGQAADLIVSVDKSTLQSSGTDTATVTVTAVDANRNAVTGAAVTITPDANAVVTASATTTDTTGIVTGTLGVGSDHSNRVIDLVVTSGSITKHATVTVTGASLQATVGAATPGSTATIQYHLIDGSNKAIADTPISVTLSGNTVTATTDLNGKYTFSYTVPATASLSIVAKAAGVETDSTVTTSTGTTAAASGTVQSASISANPSNVGINAIGSTSNQIDVRALFLGASNAPIQFARVRFDLDNDLNGIGGTLTSGSGYVYTDANGVARTAYIPGTRSSGNQALTIRACWSQTDFDVSTCPNEVTTDVTVVSTGVSVSIFTNNKIVTDDTKSIYQIGFAVQVVDSVGQPIQGVLVSGSVDLPRYYRGFYNASGAQWTPVVNVGTQASPSLAPGQQSCDNEDVNRNDVLETYSNAESEDANGSHKLEPYKADVEIAPQTTGSNTTDVFGKAYFVMQYGQNVASWDDFTLTFSTIVQGTEGRAQFSGNLPVPAAALTLVTASPPFQFSPYNFAPVNTLPALVHTVPIVDPTTNKTATLCQAQP
jgi:hypothetical protein